MEAPIQTKHEERAIESQQSRKSPDTFEAGELISAGSQHLHRRLGGKEIQLFAVGGAIGTSLYVQMGASLPKGGPAGLFLGFVLYGTIVLAVNQCFAEMVTYMPIASPFVRLGAFNIPYEITAIHVLLTYWTDKVHVGVVVAVCLVIYSVLNGLTVKYFGISEFYMSIFKIFLMLGLMMYTFITMVGGNPDKDPYGFRYWRDPGAFVEYLVPGDTGRFLGLLSCMIQGSFTMRLMFFFIGGALCVGIVIPSPYVISMVKFGIKGVPDLVNALIMTSVLSAGNNVVFSAARTLHGMALDGKAPSFLAKCNKYGLPYYAVTISLLFCFLSLLQIGNTSSTVLSWFVGICTASYLLNYFGTVVTYLHFYYTMQRKGMSRETLPYKSRFQPFAAWYALVGTFLMTLVLGYTVFIDGQWDTTTFFTSYTMVGFFVVAFAGWKVIRRTRYVRVGEADLGLGKTKEEIDLYEALYEKPRRGRVLRWLNEWFE
ncbi:amino acid permease-domain-containing protein [Aspergillus filifer]